MTSVDYIDGVSMGTTNFRINNISSAKLNGQGSPDLDTQQLSVGQVVKTEDGRLWMWNDTWILLSAANLTTDTSATSAYSGSSSIKVGPSYSVGRPSYRYLDDLKQHSPTDSTIRAGVEDLLTELREDIRKLPLDDHWKTSKQIYSKLVSKLTLLLYNK